MTTNQIAPRGLATAKPKVSVMLAPKPVNSNRSIKTRNTTRAAQPAGTLIVMPAPGVGDRPTGATRDSELRAAVLDFVRPPNLEINGQGMLEYLKVLGFDVTQSETLQVLQHLHDHGYITCEEKLRPLVPLTDLSRLSRIEITPVGCDAVNDFNDVGSL